MTDEGPPTLSPSDLIYLPLPRPRPRPALLERADRAPGLTCFATKPFLSL